MGNKSLRAALAAFVFALFAATASAQVSVSISFFHDTLAPHGRWVATSSYGDCWAPSGVAAGWAPYVDGQWVWTDYGWTWASADPWGDIAYHYGTWVWSPPYGWVWVPGTVWAPAWVTWAYSDDYIGWAPVPVSFALGGGGYVGAPIVVSQSSYVFVPSRQFVGVPVASVRVPAAQTAAIYARSQRGTAFPVQGGIVHNTGLPIARAERAVGHQIAVTRAPERVKAEPIPAGKSVRVVAPAAERAAAINRSGGTPNSRAAKAAPAEPQARHEAKPKKQPAQTHGAPPESQARHEAQPSREPAHAHAAPAEPQARHEAQPKKQPAESRAHHEPQPKKEPPEKPAVPPGHNARKEHAPASEAAAREPVTREAAAPPPHAQPKAAPRDGQRPDARAQHGNPHAQPQHAKPQHEEPGRDQ